VHCPQCQHLDCKVIESRPSEERVRRRRQCQACGERFTTMERIEYKYPLVVKKDGQRESYDPAKVMAGFQLACRKRPVSADDLDSAMDRLGQRLRSTQVVEIPSANVGKMVLEELKELDMVAYLRFASVYMEIASPGEFMELLQPWMSSDRRAGGR
jgi:transcriptional repressor NrdR